MTSPSCARAGSANNKSGSRDAHGHGGPPTSLITAGESSIGRRPEAALSAASSFSCRRQRLLDDPAHQPVQAGFLGGFLWVFFADFFAVFFAAFLDAFFAAFLGFLPSCFLPIRRRSLASSSSRLSSARVLGAASSRQAFPAFHLPAYFSIERRHCGGCWASSHRPRFGIFAIWLTSQRMTTLSYWFAFTSLWKCAAFQHFTSGPAPDFTMVRLRPEDSSDCARPFRLNSRLHVRGVHLDETIHKNMQAFRLVRVLDRLPISGFRCRACHDPPARYGGSAQVYEMSVRSFKYHVRKKGTANAPPPFRRGRGAPFPVSVPSMREMERREAPGPALRRPFGAPCDRGAYARRDRFARPAPRRARPRRGCEARRPDAAPPGAPPRGSSLVIVGGRPLPGPRVAS